MKIPRVPTLAFAASLLAFQAVSAAQKITVTVTNDLEIPRPVETIVVPWSQIVALLPEAQIDHLEVLDAGGKILPTQVTNFHPDEHKQNADELIFQHDFAAGEKQAVFTVETTADPVPPFPDRTFGRYVPERNDDFAWENDVIGHRIYGPKLETPAAGKDQMISSGIDVWCKRVPWLIVNRWYTKSLYHAESGEGLDMYDVGKSRGCGGVGIWDGTTLHVSHNWIAWKVLANGPIRTVFELTYAPWDAGKGLMVSEVKRFTVDAGHPLDEIASTFAFDGGKEITVGIGLGKHPKAKSADFQSNAQEGWISLWENYAKNGELGTGVVLAPGAFSGLAEDKLNHLVLASAKSGEPLKYYAGAGWSQAGVFLKAGDWTAYLANWSKRIASPLKVKVESADTAKSAATDSLARHPFLYAGEWDTRKPLEQSMFIVRAGKVVWQYTMPLKNAEGRIQEFDDATLLSNGNVIFSHMSGASEISPEKKIVWDYPAPIGTEVHSVQSVGKDRVLIMRNGNPAKAMIINTSTGKTEKEITIPTPITGTHGQFRHIRMTPAGTILVPHLSEGKVVEYNLDGQPIWSVAAPNAWSAVRLKNGNTLIAGDAKGYVREVNPQGETVWEFTQADAPFKVFNLQTAQRLANGNTVLANWCAGDKKTEEWPGTVQVAEVTPEKKIAWTISSWKNPDLGPATSIQLLDEPGAPENPGEQER